MYFIAVEGRSENKIKAIVLASSSEVVICTELFASFIICISAYLPICMCNIHIQCPWRLKEVIRSGIGIIHGCVLPRGC